MGFGYCFLPRFFAALSPLFRLAMFFVGPRDSVLRHGCGIVARRNYLGRNGISFRAMELRAGSLRGIEITEGH